MPFGYKMAKNDGFTKMSVELWKSYIVKMVTYILFTENFPTIDQSNSCNTNHNGQRIGHNQEIQSGNFLISICDI